MSSDEEFAVTVSPADGNANAPGSRGDRDAGPDGREIPMHKGPLRFYVDLDYSPSYMNKSYMQTTGIMGPGPINQQALQVPLAECFDDWEG